jgi:hypothetical protein
MELSESTKALVSIGSIVIGLGPFVILFFVRKKEYQRLSKELESGKDIDVASTFPTKHLLHFA